MGSRSISRDQNIIDLGRHPIGQEQHLGNQHHGSKFSIHILEDIKMVFNIQ